MPSIIRLTPPAACRLLVTACCLLLAALLLPAFAFAGDDGPPRRVYITDPAGTWAKSGLLDYGEFLARLAQADVVFLGEYHDDANTHVLQAEILAELHALREGHVVLSMEQFERDVQDKLDAYLAGSLDEQAFLAGSRPWPNYDPDYRRMVEFAKANGLPVCAANIPRPFASRITKQGFDAAWAGYTPEERPWICEATTAPKDAYYNLFLQTMGGGGGAHGMGMSEELIYTIYQAQCIKDDTMAESIARLRAADPARMVVHTNGSFHSDYRLGTVMRVIARRSPPATAQADKVLVVAIRPVSGWSQATAHAEDLEASQEGDPAGSVADFVLYVPGPDFGKLNPAVPPTPQPEAAAEQAEGMPPAMPALPPAPPAAPAP